MDISTLEGNQKITGLEAVFFHMKRLGSALGIDPSLLGFDDLLSDGLGDGGFFSISIPTAMKSRTLRETFTAGLEEPACIHVAYKFNK